VLGEATVKSTTAVESSNGRKEKQTTQVTMSPLTIPFSAVVYPGIFFGGVQPIQLRTEDRENGDLGAVAPLSGVLEAAVIWYKKLHFIQ